MTQIVPQAVPADSVLLDRYGRRVTYLRLSITDRCDFRCTYCMAEKMVFLPRSAVMNFDECVRVARIFVGLGVIKLRVTGGEPLVRQGALALLARLGRLPGLRSLVLTTNGAQLERFAQPLLEAGVARINISLDSLRAERFKDITRVGALAKVLRGIEAVRTLGFKGIKLNTVLLRGRNDDELIELVQFAVARAIDISFIEEMPLGEVASRQPSSGAGFLRGDEVLARLRAHFDLLPWPGDLAESLPALADPAGGPARYWQVRGSATRIGLITPHSQHFCASCNRVRVTAQGVLYPCLGSEESVALLPLLRVHPDDDAPVRAAIVQGMGLKVQGHDFDAQRNAPKIMRFMSLTGG